MPLDPGARLRRSRLRLYAPFVLLGLIALGWSVAWFVIRGRTVDGLDAWLAAEGAAGRRWTCADRTVAGFPFRIEIGCGSLALDRPDVSATLGRLGVVAQVYRPGHVIAEVSGPLRMRVAGATVDGDWQRFRASVVTVQGAFDRASVVVDAPTVSVAGDGSGPVALSARQLETHVRPNPNRPDTWDAVLRAGAAVVPGLDGLVGGTAPADLQVTLDVTRAADLPARPIAAEFERWRQAGGLLEVSRVAFAKGATRVEASGRLGLDEQHRAQGQFDLAAANLEGLLGRFVGERSGLAGGLLGALLGASKPPSAPAASISQVPGGGPLLRPLPPVRLEGGRLLLGPFPVPGVRLPPLY